MYTICRLQPDYSMHNYPSITSTRVPIYLPIGYIFFLVWFMYVLCMHSNLQQHSLDLTWELNNVWWCCGLVCFLEIFITCISHSYIQYRYLLYMYIKPNSTVNHELPSWAPPPKKKGHEQRKLFSLYIYLLYLFYLSHFCISMYIMYSLYTLLFPRYYITA